MAKAFRLRADQIEPLATGRGACMASDDITVRGRKVGFMYREAEPHNELDSGWRFLSGLESQDYMDDPDNHGVYDVNTISNYDASIIEHLEAAPGSAFERTPGAARFRPVTDWSPPDD